MTIIGILMWMMQCSQSHAWGVCLRMTLGVDDEWPGNRTKFDVSQYHYVNICGVDVGKVSETIHMDLFIFSMNAKYVKYSMPLCVQGVLNSCLWIVPAFLYRVQGHGHITLQSMCNVWIDEMWNTVGTEILLLSIFVYFSPKNPASQWDPENARRDVLTHVLLWLRRLQ